MRNRLDTARLGRQTDVYLSSAVRLLADCLACPHVLLYKCIIIKPKCIFVIQKIPLEFFLHNGARRNYSSYLCVFTDTSNR